MPGINSSAPKLSWRLKGFCLFAIALTLAFSVPLWNLACFAWQSSLHSHALLIPLIAGYLLWLRRGESLPEPRQSLLPAMGLAAAGFGMLAALWLGSARPALPPADSLALSSASYLSLLAAGAFLFLGGPLLRRFSFPLVMLIFLIPMPVAVENAVEIFFQHASAEAAALLFLLTGSTVFREGLAFHLPGIVLQVAQECSGIRSSLVLFITSLIAGHMFLKSPYRRAALTLFVIPLAIFRNGFRIFTLGMLCVHVSPTMIESPIHHRGGPVFFILSLLPFFLLMLWLRRQERRPPGDAISAGMSEKASD